MTRKQYVPESMALSCSRSKLRERRIRPPPERQPRMESAGERLVSATVLYGRYWPRGDYSGGAVRP